MTHIFKKDGTMIPVTVVEAGPCYVTQIKTKDTDHYSAVQLGFDETPERKLRKPLRGHLKRTGKFLKNFAEFRMQASSSQVKKVGDEITVSLFEEGTLVQVTGVSKGKGYQGVVKRHGFAGSPATHGHKDQLRMPGSIGATDPQRVFKGRRMAGHMGNSRVTLKNLKIVKIDPEKAFLYLTGAVPGARGTLLKIQTIEKDGDQE